uniref:CYRIA/CYRIB Rac1 binding domain-containing protein n=1 Tax=Poecilia reticulata TaxID=8081 RepID=A0A3P9PYK5_POERE
NVSPAWVFRSSPMTMLHTVCRHPNAQPTEAETAVWNQVSAVLEEAHGILAELQSYNGAGQEIREVRRSTETTERFGLRASHVEIRDTDIRVTVFKKHQEHKRF